MTLADYKARMERWRKRTLEEIHRGELYGRSMRVLDHDLNHAELLILLIEAVERLEARQPHSIDCDMDEDCGPRCGAV